MTQRTWFSVRTIFAIGVVLSAATPVAAAPRGGCMGQSASFRAAAELVPISRASLPADVGQSLERALSRAASAFEVRPAFRLFADGSPNAFAYQTPGSRPLVAIGLTLLAQAMRRPDHGISLVAVLAHELGHIAQFTRGADLTAGEPTVRRQELHADFLAGWYLAKLQRRLPDVKLWHSGELFAALGDTNFGSRNHHGTPKQRSAAVDAGYRFAKRREMDIDRAFDLGASYISRLNLDGAGFEDD